ncbi:protein-(glutamine-N5) methyltransferase, release factor-specific [Candidatus Epulonipiscioides gigas]|nr:protein-(glutamine-N5) methyltransferase, release factor-specific [Epulopiscium sp. SCG-C07WGA-EpuloA2]
MQDIKTLLASGTKSLQNDDISDAILDARFLLMNVLNCDRTYLIMNGDKLVEDELILKYYNFIERRKKHEPVQYIINYQEFMGLPFYVNKNVLIPRQDTELLVEKVISLLKNTDIIGLEIGVGSGCISISLLNHIKNLTMACSDISKDALDVAKNNAQINDCINRMNFIQSNLFEHIKEKKYNFIVSNPPYIPKDEMDSLQAEVLEFEPTIALTDNNDGLYFYRAIAKQGKKYLTPCGFLAFEIGYNQGFEVTKILEVEGYKDIQLFYDYNNKHRVIIANANGGDF